MGGTDNLLAGLEGLLGGISNVVTPVLTHRAKAGYDAELRRKQMEQEYQQKIDFLPQQEASTNRIAQYAAGLQPREKIYNVHQASGLQIGEPFVGEPNENIRLNPVGVVPKDDYISGLDILLGRPDLKDSIDPAKKYNKAMLPFLKASATSTRKLEGKEDAEFAISEINRIMPLNEKSSGGIYGRARQGIMSAFDAEDEKFRNTEDVVNTLKSIVSKVLKSTFGGQLSDGERAYLNEVYGAADGYSRAQRRIAMTNVQRMLENKVSGNINVSSGSTNAGTSSGGLSPEEAAEMAQLEKEVGGKP